MTESTKQRLTKQSVSAWFEQRQAENRRRRVERVSATDIRHRLEGRRFGRAARDRRDKLAVMLPAALGVALLVCAGAISMYTYSNTQRFEAETAATGHAIEIAKGELARIPTARELDSEGYVDVVRGRQHDATEAGQEMARLQQDYATILFQGNGTTRDDRVSEQALTSAIEHQGLLAAHIRDQAIPTAGSALEDDTLDPRTPWYVGFEADGITVVDPSTSRWELVSVMPIDEFSFELTWLNRGPSDLLYAWATARYYSEDGKFGQFTVGKSTRGADNVEQVQTGRK